MWSSTGGGNLLMELTDVDPGEVSVGMRVGFAFRVKDVDPLRRLQAVLLESGAGLSMAMGIRDKVAIVGMGCSKFGERWDSGPDDLIVEAVGEALTDAGIERDQIGAAWLGVFFDEQSVGKSALPLSMALRLPNIAITRVENLCATGTEALRGAVYAVAAGACDIALAVGVEKLKDTGYSGLPGADQGDV